MLRPYLGRPSRVPDVCSTGRHLFSFFNGLLNGADHVKSLFRDIVVFAIDDFFEAANRVLQFHIGAGSSSEGFGDVKGLGQEALNFARPSDGHAVFFRKLIHTENRDDILQILIALQNQLHRTSDLVMLRADDMGIQNPRSSVERIDGGINAQLGDLSRKNRGRIEMSKGRRRSRIGEIVGRDINSLDGCYRTFMRRRYTFLQFAQVGRQGRLITDS